MDNIQGKRNNNINFFSQDTGFTEEFASDLAFSRYRVILHLKGSASENVEKKIA